MEARPILPNIVTWRDLGLIKEKIRPRGGRAHSKRYLGNTLTGWHVGSGEGSPTRYGATRMLERHRGFRPEEWEAKGTPEGQVHGRRGLPGLGEAAQQPLWEPLIGELQRAGAE